MSIRLSKCDRRHLAVVRAPVLLVTIVLIAAAGGTAESDLVNTGPPASPQVLGAGTAATVASDWNVFCGGGSVGVASASHRGRFTIGQQFTGGYSSSGLSVGLGFWYGAHGCDCRRHADIDGDGAPTAVDLQLLIQIIFFAAPDVTDPFCPVRRTDLNCSGVTNATDLTLLINILFFGGTVACAPCL